jgi:hypothetical protein
LRNKGNRLFLEHVTTEGTEAIVGICFVVMGTQASVGAHYYNSERRGHFWLTKMTPCQKKSKIPYGFFSLLFLSNKYVPRLGFLSAAVSNETTC